MLSEEVHRSQRFGYEFSLLFLDLDHFKHINDQHGHLIGSKLLGQVGQTLRNNLRLVDSAFRYGGDEFVILLPQTSKEAALLVARRLTAVFHAYPWLVGATPDVSLRASIGIAAYPVDGTTPQAIVQRADEMMYLVKQAGRDNIAVAGVGIVGGEKSEMVDGDQDSLFGLSETRTAAPNSNCELRLAANCSTLLFPRAARCWDWPERWDSLRNPTRTGSSRQGRASRRLHTRPARDLQPE